MNHLRRTALPLMLVASLASSESAMAQPTDLFVCTSAGPPPTCSEVLGPSVGTPPQCIPRFYDVFVGRVAWWPLRCVGSITIEVETIAIYPTHYPVYVEVVPLRQPPAPCANDPGYLIWTLRGTETDCGGWETSSPIDITRLVPIGSLYALRLHYFHNLQGFSVGTDCIRVTATPGTSGTAQRGWGPVKALYR